MASPVSDDILLAWLWLSFISLPGSTLGDQLISGFGLNIEKIYKADNDAYKGVGSLRSDTIARLCDKDLKQAREILGYCRNNNIAVLCPDSPEYPPRLRRIQRKPLILYVRGRLPDMEDNVCIAMVGTRNMTEYGQHSAYTLSYDMAKAGAIIVSGMAKGVDGMSHRGCLDAGGVTVAVLGCGVDRAYPAEHAGLMTEILRRRGAVVSEFRPFTPPEGRNFPIRNRIISGFSQGTVVVEAGDRSGALITAKTALLQGRDLFAVPGKLGEMNSIGTNSLIQDGAKMVTEAADILAEYEPLYSHRINLAAIPSFRMKMNGVKPFVHNVAAPKPDALRHSSLSPVLQEKIANAQPASVPPVISAAGSPPPESKTAPEKKPPDAELTDAEKAAYAVMSETVGMTMDEIARKAGITAAQVMVCMTMLEIKRAVRALPGGLFIRQEF